MPTVPGELQDDDIFGAEIAPPAPAGELSDADVFGNADESLRQRARLSAYDGVDLNPAQVLESESLGRRFGVPSALVSEDLDEARRNAQADDMAELAVQQPELGGWLAQDPSNVAVARDDVGVLSEIAGYFKNRVTLAHERAAIDGLVSSVGTGIAGAGSLVDAGARGIDRNIRTMFGDEFADLMWFDGPKYANPTELLQAGGGAVETAGHAIGPGAEDRGFATDVMSGLGQVTGQAAATIMNPAVGLGLMASQGAELQADRARAAGTYGDATSDAAIAGGAAITAVTERLGLGLLMRRLPEPIKAVIAKKVGDILLAGVGEGAQEVTEGLLQDVVTQALVDENFEGQTIAELTKGEGAIAASVGVLFRGMLHMGRARADAEQAKHDATQIEAIGKLVDRTSLATADPGRLREVLGKLKGAGWSDVWVPLEQFQTLFQSAPEADEARRAAGITDAEYSAALLGGPGARVRIPTEGFFAGLDPAQREKLYKHVRRKSDGMTPEEAENYDPKKALEEFVSALGVRGQPADDPATRVYEDMRLQLEQAGASPDVAAAQAEQFAAFVRTMSERTGLDMATIAGRVSVQGPLDPRLDAVLKGRDVLPAVDSIIEAIRSGRTFTDAEVKGGRMASALVQAGGLRPDKVGAGELRGMDAGKRPGLTNLAGMTLDEALEWARASGFIDAPLTQEQDQYDANAPDINTFLDLLAADLGGIDPVFASGNLNMDRQAFNEAVSSFEEMLSERGIDPAKLEGMTNAQVRAAVGIGGEQDANGETLDQPDPEAGFRAWSKGAEVYAPDEIWNEYQGGPAVFRLYHGTTGDFEVFDRSRANPESDLGAGFYFSNTVDDVGANYAGEGPDLTNKIERRAEQLFDEMEDDERAALVEEATGKPWSELSYEEKRQPLKDLARRELSVQNNGLTMPVFVRVDNPAIIGGDNETTLTFEQEYDEETEDYSEPTGTLLDFTEALREVASDEGVFDANVDDAIDALMSAAMDAGEGLALSEVYRILKADEHFAYVTDENGTIVRDELIRQALEESGFDAIIDYTVDAKFGSQKRVGKPMEGMTDETVHVVAFKPTQVKSAIGNSGAFDQKNPSILHQSAVPEQFAAADRTRKFKHGDTSITYSSDGETVTAILIHTPKAKRGGGSGRAAFEAFLRETDAAGLPVEGAVAEQDSSTDGGKLMAFYESLGFRDTGEVTEDGSPKIRREPVRASAVDQTQTPEFNEWFGGSKVVDAEGKPLVVYHGTRNDFDTFEVGRPTKNSSVFGEYDAERAGIFFAVDSEFAGDYAVGGGKVLSSYLAINDPIDLTNPYKLSEGFLNTIEDHGYDPRKFTSTSLATWELFDHEYGGEQLVKALKAMGYDGALITEDDRAGGEALVWVAFEPTQVKSATDNDGTFDADDPSFLSQQGDSTKRGSLTITPDRRFLIRIGEAADFSTFLHESGHFFLEAMREINAELSAIPADSRTQAQSKVLADHAALLKFLGVDSFSQIGVEQHEKFAESYEAYLREGKAPSPRLERAFQKFGAWLRMIYRTLLNLPRAKVNDEIRGVMDRMLATDQEIDEARAGQSLGGVFTGMTPEAAGMTHDEFANYTEALRVARESAIADESAEQYRYERAQARRWRSEEMRRLRAEALAEIDLRRDVQAKYLLMRGTKPDGSPLPPEQEPFKLNTQWLTDHYGKAWVQKNLAFMHAADGKHPGAAAVALDYPDAESMLQAIAAVGSRKDMARAAAEQRWRELHPDPALDGEVIDRVQRHVHNEAQAEVMAREIDYLSRLAGSEGRRPVLSAMRAAAERIASETVIADLNPQQHRYAEATAGRLAIKAAAAQQWADALKHRRQQLWSGLMYRAALNAKEQAETDRDLMVRASKKPAQERLARAGWEHYLERVNDILHAYDVRRLSVKELQRRTSMRAWVDSQQEAGEITAIPAELIAKVEANRVSNWREVTAGEFSAAADALRNVQHLASLKNKLTAAARSAERADAIAEMVERAETSLPDRVSQPVSEADLTDPQRAARKLAAMRDDLNRPENMIEALDGGQSGPWHDFIWHAMAKAEERMVDLRRELGFKLRDLRLASPPDLMARMAEPVNVFGLPTTRGTLVAMVLNTGNAGNVQRLQDGGIEFDGKRVRLSDAQVVQLRAMLSPDELAYVQGLWDAVGSLWGDIVALQRRMSGLPPEKVAEQEFTVRGETYRGGYWPIAYDRNRSAVGEHQAGDDALQVMMSQGFTRAATPKGYQKARAEQVEASLQLDFAAVLSRHLDQVMTDLAYREAVRDVVGLLKSEPIKEVVLARLGRPAYESLQGAVSYAVSASSTVAGHTARQWQRFADAVLSNMTVSALAIRPDIALGNYASAMVQGLDRVGVRALLRGLWRSYTPGRGDLTERIKELSPFMRERLEDNDRVYRQELQRTARKSGLGEAYKRVMFTLHRTADHEVTRALWWGRYQQAIDAGENGAEAVRLADKAIRQTQTAMGRKDLSTFERDPSFRQSRQFMGPMFVMFGRMNAAARGQGATSSIGARASTALLQVFLAPAIFALAAGRWARDGDDEDDEVGPGDWAIWLAANTLLFPIQTLPLLRDVGAAAESLATGNPINARAAPVAQAVAAMGKAGHSIWENLSDEDEDGEVDYLEATRDLATLAGPLTGAPASQTRNWTRAAEYLRDHPETDATEMARLIVYGPPRK